VDYHAVRLPERLRCLLMVRSTCYIAHYALASSLTSPGSFLSDWSTAQGEWTGLVHHWQPATIAGRGAHRQYRPSAQRAGGADILPRALRWPDRSWVRVPSSLGGAQPRQASTVLIRRRISYFYTDEAARKTELHSTATDGSPASQVKRGITAR
jgi:hypothetical protein